jgi:hypothetical protein
MWNWRVDENNRINFPDYQGRIYRKGLMWNNKVHEKIVGAKIYSILPIDESGYFLQHHKTITKQEQQNNLYNTI